MVLKTVAGSAFSKNYCVQWRPGSNKRGRQKVLAPICATLISNPVSEERNN
jgi:hypothetical protein